MVELIWLPKLTCYVIFIVIFCFCYFLLELLSSYWEAKQITADTSQPLHSAWTAPVWTSIQSPRGQLEHVQEVFYWHTDIKHRMATSVNTCYFIRSALWHYLVYLLSSAHFPLLYVVYFTFIIMVWVSLFNASMLFQWLTLPTATE